MKTCVFIRVITTIVIVPGQVFGGNSYAYGNDESRSDYRRRTCQECRSGFNGNSFGCDGGSFRSLYASRFYSLLHHGIRN